MQGAHSQSTLRLSLPCLHLSGEHIRFVARQLRCGCQSTVQLRIHIESDEVLSLQSLQTAHASLNAVACFNNS